MERMYRLPNMVASAARAFFKAEPEEHNMVMFDLGAGTLDVAVVTIKGNVCQVRSTAGDAQLGGSDFDKNMVDHFVKRLHKDVINIPSAVCKLKTFCEKAKMLFSEGHGTVPIKIIPLCDDVSLDASISDVKFHTLNKDLFQTCINIMGTCLRDARMGVDNVNEVILAGGATRIPMLRSKICDLFRGKEVIFSQHLESAAVYGAAMQSFFLSTRKSARDPPLCLIDVAPFSLGLQSAQGEMAVFVPKNATIPTKVQRTIHSQIPHKSQICFLVYEGEGRLISQNRLLGKFELPPTQFSPKGRDINVCFEVLENCTLIVRAEEISSGTQNSLIITHNLSEDSMGRVWEAFIENESETSIIKASPTRSLTRSDTSGKWDQIRDRKTLAKLISSERETPGKIIAQSRRQYVEPEEYAIGIDFGTTYSSVAVWQRNGVKILENEYGSRLTCSAVAFTDTGRLIGDTIHKEQVTTNPANTIHNIKRLIGRCYSDQPIENDGKNFSFKILSDTKNRPMVSVQYKNKEKAFAPEEIAAMILSKMKEVAEEQLHSKVTKAVISIPASFSDSQRKAIKNAGAIAGLEVMQLLNEPTATAIAYFLQKNTGKSSPEKTLLIFDLGGGNLDVSIVAIKGGSIRVQAVSGDTNLGGEDFDDNMVSHCVEKFIKERRRNIRNKPRSLRRLKAACEKAKRVLSTNSQTLLEIDALDEGIDFRIVITRKVFEEINEDLFKRCISCVERCLEDAEMDENNIDEVVLVGGSTRIPKLHQLIQEFFKGKEICKSINADEAVVYGAAVRAAILSGNENREDFNMLLEDVTSRSLEIENKYGETMNLLIPKHTPIPTKKELILTTCADNLANFSVQVQECESASSMVFALSGITPKPRVKSKINAILEVDISGIVNLTAKEMSSRGKNEIVIIKENGGLTKEEIETMVESAIHYKAEDDEHKARAAELNSLENFAYKIKAMTRDAGLSVSSKQLVDKAADDAIAWLETNHHAAIREITGQKEKLETIKNQVITSAALNSLGTITNEIKTIASDARVPVSHKKLLEVTAYEAIAWLETNPHAGIGEINTHIMHLETIKSQVKSNALNYLGNIACEIKEIACDPRYSASDRISMEEAADKAIALLGTDNNADFDLIYGWTEYLESTKRQFTLMEP